MAGKGGAGRRRISLRHPEILPSRAGPLCPLWPRVPEHDPGCPERRETLSLAREPRQAYFGTGALAGLPYQCRAAAPGHRGGSPNACAAGKTPGKETPNPGPHAPRLYILAASG